MRSGETGERLARRAIEDRGFIAIDANILFRQNCPNIDIIAFGRDQATYLQVKSTRKASGRNCVIVDGSAWTHQQLYENAPIYNKHDSFHAHFVLLIDHQDDDNLRYFLAPPQEVEDSVRARGLAWAAKPKRDGSPRSIGFRKELPHESLAPWQDAWHLLGAPVSAITDHR